MKKSLLISVIVYISIFIVSGTSIAWQGRMAGMGDPYGLVQDESDMLIHPAMIMNVSGTQFYSHYRFSYTDVSKWDCNWNFSNPSVPYIYDYDFNGSGDEYRNEVLLGSTFNLGSGRMGVFLTYENRNGDYDGNIEQSGSPWPDSDFDMDSDMNDFTLRFLYGFPADHVDLGFEAGVAYRNEKNKAKQELFGLSTTNNMFPIMLSPNINAWSNIYPYMVPYDSEYYDAFLKASVAGELGDNANFGLTVTGGSVFSGDNKFKADGFIVSTGEYYATKMDGNVDGWSLGGDFWLRYKVNDDLTLPFLVNAGYLEKNRDGDDFSVFSRSSADYDYKHKEINWDIEAGGGLDVKVNDTSKIASGIYYRYLENSNSFDLVTDIGGGFQYGTDMDVPDYNEHRITFTLAYEKETSPTIGFRAGFNCFYGWADWDYKNQFDAPLFGSAVQEKVSMDGDLWGIGLTLGSTIEMEPVTLEPFIGAAYQQTDLDGDGAIRLSGFVPSVGNPNATVEGENKKDQWMFTAGLSLLF